MENQKLSSTENSLPLPELWNSSKNQTVLLPQNTWELRVETVPLHAEKQFYTSGPQVGFPRALRSPFRSGEMHFSEAGMTFRGIEVRPNKILSVIATVLGVFLYIGQAVVRGLRNSTPMVSAIIVGVCVVCIVALIVIYQYNERRRFPTEVVVPWNEVHGVLVDANLKWLTLVLVHPESKPKQKRYQFLSFDKLDAAMITGIADVVSQYAPHALRKTTRYSDWTILNKVMTFVTIAIFIGLAGFLAWMILNRP